MRALAWILAEDVLAFSYGSEGESADDFSTAQLERVIASLREADASVKHLFCDTVREMAEEARLLGDEVRAERLFAMPRKLRLVSRAKV